MEETSKNNETAQLGIGDVSGSFSLKFWEEDMIRNKMKQSEKLIRLFDRKETRLHKVKH